MPPAAAGLGRQRRKPRQAAPPDARSNIGASLSWPLSPYFSRMGLRTASQRARPTATALVGVRSNGVQLAAGRQPACRRRRGQAAPRVLHLSLLAPLAPPRFSPAARVPPRPLPDRPGQAGRSRPPPRRSTTTARPPRVAPCATGGPAPGSRPPEHRPGGDHRDPMLPHLQAGTRALHQHRSAAAPGLLHSPQLPGPLHPRLPGLRTPSRPWAPAHARYPAHRPPPATALSSPHP